MISYFATKQQCNELKLIDNITVEECDWEGRLNLRFDCNNEAALQECRWVYKVEYFDRAQLEEISELEFFEILAGNNFIREH